MTEDVRTIRFHYIVKPFYFPFRNDIKRFLWQQLKHEGKNIEAINFIFCSDAYLLQMNQEYLRHNTLTDIITFELSAPNEPLIADIYISVERVRENASSFGCAFSEELRRVIFHGALHLAGYKDKKKSEAEIMRKMEDEYLTAFIVSRDTVS